MKWGWTPSPGVGDITHNCVLSRTQAADFVKCFTIPRHIVGSTRQPRGQTPMACLHYSKQRSVCTLLTMRPLLVLLMSGEGRRGRAATRRMPRAWVRRPVRQMWHAGSPRPSPDIPIGPATGRWVGMKGHAPKESISQKWDRRNPLPAPVLQLPGGFRTARTQFLHLSFFHHKSIIMEER